jgi:hypothetical protein
MRIPSPSTLLALALSLSFGVARADEPKSLDALMNQYRELGLPFPPKDAKLVRVPWDSGRQTGQNKFSLEFITKPATKSQRAELFSIWFERQLDRDKKIEEANPDLSALNDVPPAGLDDLLLAVQCQARGWNALAKALLERYLKESETPPSKQLVELSWEYWVKQLSAAKIDRAPIAKRLKELIDKNEDLNKQPNRTLLNALNLALVPSKAKPGSIEALIDDLVNFNAEDQPEGLDWRFKPESRYWRIAKLGFEAVPVLIEHLDDLRLTRSLGGALINNWSTYHEQVCHVVSRLLEGLAGDFLGRDGLDPLRGNPSEKDAARKWWTQAKKVGEERYLVEHVIRKTDSAISEDGINIIMLNLIVAKYPKHVPELFRAALEKNPKTECWIWVEALLDCKLPEKEKLELLLDLYQKASVNRRMSLLSGIKRLDRNRFNSLLLAMLEETPADKTGHGWSETDIDNVVLKGLCSEDAEVLAKLEKVVRRAKPDLRVQMLRQLVWRERDDGWQDRMRFLAKFLDDTSPSHGWPRENNNIEIRNAVAYYIARFLQIDNNIDQLRTIEDWAKFRSRVQESLKRELRNPPNPNP